MTSKGNAATLMARARGAQPEETFETFVDADNAGDGDARQTARVARSGYGTLVVYKLTPAGSVRTRVAVQSINEVLSQPDYAAECHDCGSPECRYQTINKGEVSTNECAGKAPRQYRICPINSCRKRIYDPIPTGRFKMDEFDHSTRNDEEDPNVIRDEEYTTSTPASRTKSAMDLHIIGFHPATAMEMGIGRPAEMPRLAVVS